MIPVLDLLNLNSKDFHIEFLETYDYMKIVHKRVNYASTF